MHQRFFTTINCPPKNTFKEVKMKLLKLICDMKTIFSCQKLSNIKKFTTKNCEKDCEDTIVNDLLLIDAVWSIILKQGTM